MSFLLIDVCTGNYTKINGLVKETQISDLYIILQFID